MTENEKWGRLLPDDELNRALLANVHPADWTNPTPTGTYNLLVIGAGPAGLEAALGAAGLGAKVALVEKHLLGGDGQLRFGSGHRRLLGLLLRHGEPRQRSDR